MDLVIARYNENIDWIKKVPNQYNIYIYNKGDNKMYSDNRCKIINLPNIGRESDSYLTHIINNYDNLAELTIFTQGDPFPHSPDFIQLLSSTNYYKSIQPLTDRWLLDHNTPPLNILQKYKQDNIIGGAICAYPICLTSFQKIWFHDEGAIIIAKKFLEYFKLDNGTNIAEFIFNKTGFKIDKYPYLCHCCYSAIFAVKKQHILKHSKICYDNLRKLNNDAQEIFPWAIEQLWLFLFGYEDITGNQLI